MSLVGPSVRWECFLNFVRRNFAPWAAENWGAGIHHWGAGTAWLQKTGALESHPVWDFKNIKGKEVGCGGVGWEVVRGRKGIQLALAL